MLSLYRKYRPQTFEEVIEEDHIKIVLQNQVKMNRPGHAYLFAGPRGIGKTSIARIFAKAINCVKKSKDGEPCNRCDLCVAINDGNCFDVIEIDAASNRGVDDARDLRERTRFAPSSAAYKIFILDEAHMLTPEAFNALLKTLEEPPSYIIFILATTELHKVPDTIVSRCQQFDFKKVSIDGLVHLLKTIARKEGAQVEDAVLNAIARNASGSARDAESILSQILSLGEKKITMEIASIVLPHSGEEEVYAFIESLVHKKTKEAIEYINKIFFEGIDLGQFTLDCIEMTRTILLIKTGVGTENMFSPHIKNKLVEISKQIEYDSLLALLNELMHTQSSEYALIPQLPLEAMIVKVCQISDLGSQLSDI